MLLILPPQRLLFDGLHIPSPVTLRGSPGSVLEVQSGSIVVDFSSASKETCSEDSAFVLCECSVVFGSSVMRSDRLSPTPALIVMEDSNCNVEIRDCAIRGEVETDVETVCFVCNGAGFTKNPTRAALHYNSALTILSCNVSGFSEILRAGANS